MSSLNLPADLVDALAELPEAEADQLAEVWSFLDRKDDVATRVPSTEDAWRDLSRRIDSSPARAPRADRPPRRRKTEVRIIAGALFAFFVAVTGLLWWSQPVMLASTAGEVVEHVLPDGSTVILAPETQLEVDRRFAGGWLAPDTRNIRLSGEAFFDVVGGDRPFIIETHDAVVEVVGTAFSVRSRASDARSATWVVVESGTVRLRPHAEQEEMITIHRGQAAEVGSAVATDTRPTETIAGWRDGGFAIYELPLSDVLREIERRFALTILAGDDIPHGTPLTLFYGRKVDARTVLHDVALATNLEYRPIRGGYEVLRPSTSDD